MILTCRHRDLIISFHPLIGLESNMGTIYRCGLCCALLEGSYIQDHTTWHEGLTRGNKNDA